MSFYRDVLRTARKKHKCDLCHREIQKGEKYHDKAGNEPDMWTSKECIDCQPVIKEYLSRKEYDGEGYCDEFLQEWWKEEKCYICRNRFLKCVPDSQCPIFGKVHTECDYYSKYGTCLGGDTCDDMTHYCRCEKFADEIVTKMKVYTIYLDGERGFTDDKAEGFYEEVFCFDEENDLDEIPTKEEADSF